MHHFSAAPTFAAGLIAAVCAGVGVVALVRSKRSVPGRRLLLLLGAGAPAIAATLLLRQSLEPTPPDSRSLPVTRQVPVRDVTAATDGGTPVPLGRLEETVADGEVPGGYEGRLIVVDAADARSNCHGWVFTGGLFCVPGGSVDTILRDNGYATVSDPLPADLVVYRDDAGVPVHTGVVKAVGAGRFVLVESKWGQLDVFWHAADEPAYGSRFDYWRSPRDGHRLRLAPIAAGVGPPSESNPAGG